MTLAGRQVLDMGKTHQVQEQCLVCGKQFSGRDLVSGAMLRDGIAALVARDHPQWSAEGHI